MSDRIQNAENSQQTRGRPFVKGQSGNRGGRPKGYNAFRKAFRKDADVETIRERLRAIILSGEESASIAAAKLWLEYGFGKTPAAPEDNDALRESGRPLAGVPAEAILEALKGRKK